MSRSTSILNFPDVNVWIALIWDRHQHSERARLWFEQAGDEQFYFCRFTQISVLRLLTTEAVMGPDTQTMSGAWKLWDQIAADDRISFLPEPDGLERPFRSLSRKQSCSPKLWADSYLVAFAQAAGLRLITFDRAQRSRTADVLIL